MRIVRPGFGGGGVSFAAVVSDEGAGTPTGSVTFLDGGSSIGEAQVDPSGFASITTTSLAAGTHAVVASYSGDPEHAAASAVAVEVTVRRGGTSYYFISPVGDSIGEGATSSYSDNSLSLPTPHEITMFGVQAWVVMTVQTSTERWDIEFDAPSGQVLLPGTYSAARPGMQGPGQAGLDVSGHSADCSQASGTITIRKIVVDPTGVIGQLDATFSHSCEGFEPPLVGRIRYRADLPA